MEFFFHNRFSIPNPRAVNPKTEEVDILEPGTVEIICNSVPVRGRFRFFFPVRLGSSGSNVHPYIDNSSFAYDI